ncbi:MurR/RpiR family transcriptional regulator, partial [Bacillus anthracis]
LYRYIMENSEKVVYMRIRDLADAAHISTSSVLRFCRKVNCEGFSEFKVKLKMYLESEQTPSLKSTQHFLYE